MAYCSHNSPFSLFICYSDCEYEINGRMAIEAEFNCDDFTPAPVANTLAFKYISSCFASGFPFLYISLRSRDIFVSPFKPVPRTKGTTIGETYLIVLREVDSNTATDHTASCIISQPILRTTTWIRQPV